VNKLVSLTWLLWEVRSFWRFVLHSMWPSGLWIDLLSRASAGDRTKW